MRENQRMIGGRPVMVQSCYFEDGELHANVGVVQDDKMSTIYARIKVNWRRQLSVSVDRHPVSGQIMSADEICNFVTAHEAEIVELVVSLWTDKEKAAHERSN